MMDPQTVQEKFVSNGRKGIKESDVFIRKMQEFQQLETQK